MYYLLVPCTDNSSHQGKHWYSFAPGVSCWLCPIPWSSNSSVQSETIAFLFNSIAINFWLYSLIPEHLFLQMPVFRSLVGFVTSVKPLLLDSVLMLKSLKQVITKVVTWIFFCLNIFIYFLIKLCIFKAL